MIVRTEYELINAPSQIDTRRTRFSPGIKIKIATEQGARSKRVVAQISPVRPEGNASSIKRPYNPQAITAARSNNKGNTKKRPVVLGTVRCKRHLQTRLYRPEPVLSPTVMSRWTEISGAGLKIPETRKKLPRLKPVLVS